MTYDGTKITIRPSTLNGFVNCPKQWYHTFILGETTIPSARAAVGTAVHAAAEYIWTDAILKGRTENLASDEVNKTESEQRALDRFKEECEICQQMSFEGDEDLNDCERLIVKGTEVFIDDIMPFTRIPKHVEKRLSYEVPNHPVVQEVAGTIDYIGDGVIADIKTSRRKPVPSNHVLQQTTYKILCEKNDISINMGNIQGITLAKTKTEGNILPIDFEETQTRSILNKLLDTLELFNKDIVDPDLLFRGNPKYYLCSEKYCSLFNKCEYARGEITSPQNWI